MDLWDTGCFIRISHIVWHQIIVALHCRHTCYDRQSYTAAELSECEFKVYEYEVCAICIFNCYSKSQSVVEDVCILHLFVHHDQRSHMNAQE